MKVEVYFNLHNHLWSVRALSGRDKGRVIGHASKVMIRDARFAVQAAGRAKVLKERQKNVHAFVRGDLEGAVWSYADKAMTLRESIDFTSWEQSDARYATHATRYGCEVTYNPYRYATFVDRVTEEPVQAAPVVYLTSDRKVLAFDPCQMPLIEYSDAAHGY
jgi:hypothetical protein